MPKLTTKIAAGAVAVVAAVGVALIEPTPEEVLLEEQITELELLIEKRIENGQSTTVPIQKLADLERQLNAL